MQPRDAAAEGELHSRTASSWKSQILITVSHFYIATTPFYRFRKKYFYELILKIAWVFKITPFKKKQEGLVENKWDMARSAIFETAVVHWLHGL